MQALVRRFAETVASPSRPLNCLPAFPACACRGFDVDAWRAHLNVLTWPEVARQLCIAAGLGRRRPKPRKEEKAKRGEEGEDTVQDDSGEQLLVLIGWPAGGKLAASCTTCSTACSCFLMPPSR